MKFVTKRWLLCYEFLPNNMKLSGTLLDQIDLAGVLNLKSEGPVSHHYHVLLVGHQSLWLVV